MPLGRTRAALVASALLVTALPLTALATAPHLTCGPKQVGRWETIKVPSFHPVSGLTAQDAITAYTVDRARPQDVAVTNGVRIQLSHTNGCGWSDAVALDPFSTTDQPFLGSGSSIVSIGLLEGQALAAVRTGNGATSAPHVLRYDGTRWTTSDSGLPPTGSPRLLRTATDGRTAYLTVSPTNTGGSDDGTPDTPVPLPSVPPLPVPLPGGGQSGGATGLLYATNDGGATWSLRTGPGSLPNGGTGFSQLEVDPRNANWLYGLVNGRLIQSQDGGQTFTTAEGSGYTAITPMLYGTVVAFDGDGHGTVLVGPHKFVSFQAPKGITSAAYRDSDSMVMVESNGVLRLVGPFGGGIVPAPSLRPARRGSLLGDNGVQSSFHAISGHDLLRFVDPVPHAVGDPPPLAAGDAGVTPPLPGTVDPATRYVNLPVGKAATEDFTLALPKNPTPLDLFFLVDVSTSMATYIDNLKQNIHKVVDTLTAAKVDVNVGVGTLGTAPAKGEAPYPDAYAYPPTFDPNGSVRPGPTYHKPRIYQLLRKIGAPDAEFNRAINSIRLETDPPTGANHQGTYHEGQLLALEQMVLGSGIKTEQDVDAHLTTYDAVRPGQQADFRPNPDVRRIVVLASDEAFDAPYGTPTRAGSTTAAPLLDFRRTLKVLNDHRVGVFGITAGSPDSVGDMTTLARGTDTMSPNGGVSCGGDPEQQLPAGAPLVCSQEGDFSQIIATVLARLTDRQDVSLVAPAATRVLRGLDASGLQNLDVKRPNTARFRVTVSCDGVVPGTYAQDVVATLRGYPVGRARLYVSCIAPLAAFPVPLIPPPVRPLVAPGVQPPVPPPAPPPAAQPQPQPNPNVNPLTAGVTQEQEEMQLALAQQEAVRQEEDGQGIEQMAMVDRRSEQEAQALGVLAIAMAACAGLGLARLRTRTEVAVRRAR